MDDHRGATAVLVPHLEARIEVTWNSHEAFQSARRLLALAHFEKHLVHDGGFADITPHILRLLSALGAAAAAPLLPAVRKHLKSSNPTASKLAAAALKAGTQAALKKAK